MNFQFLFDESHDTITFNSSNGELLLINQVGINLFEYDINEIYSVSVFK